MALSQNGWSANDRQAVASYPLPGGSVALRKGSAGLILQWCGARWHNEVENLQWPGCWGYAERPIRGGTALSNHASGTALDLCAPRHPLGTSPTANFNPGQIVAVHRIIADTGGVVRWGGDYVGRKDGMHIEINDGVNQARCDQLWARISGKSLTPAAPPSTPTGGGVSNLHGLPVMKRGTSSPHVQSWQKWYNAYDFQPELPIIKPTDNDFGPKTEAAVKRFQQRYGLEVDGIMGAQTIGKSWDLGWRG